MRTTAIWKLSSLALLLLVFSATAAFGATKRLSLGTSTVGGSFYVLGGVWSKLISDTHKDIDISVEVTGGADTNIELVSAKDMDLGFVTTWQAGMRYNGEGRDGRKYTDIRATFPLYPAYLHIYCLADSPVRTLGDINGKRIASASAGSSSNLASKAIISSLGLSVSRHHELTTGAISGSLRDGQSDVAFTTTGVPGPFMLELEATNAVRMLQPTEKEFATLLKAVPYWTVNMIPKGSYKCTPEATKVISLWNVGLAHKDTDEELVYQLVKTTMDNLPLLAATVHGLKDTKASDILVSTIPLHKGALRYYKEVGVEIPARLLPPEAK